MNITHVYDVGGAILVIHPIGRACVTHDGERMMIWIRTSKGWEQIAQKEAKFKNSSLKMAKHEAQSYMNCYKGGRTVVEE